MINTVKNIKWIALTSFLCIAVGILTFFTFINQSFIELNDFNLQTLLIVDLILLMLFFLVIFFEIKKILRERKKGKTGSETSFRYISFFAATTLLPSIFIAVFSLILFNVGLQKYLDKKITSAINNSYDIAKNYLEEAKSSIDADILLVLLDLNTKSGVFYSDPNTFKNFLRSQRLLRKLDEIYLLDSAANIIMSDVSDASTLFIEPPEEAFDLTVSGKPIRITDSTNNRTSALVKLTSFIDSYLYIVRIMDPKITNYLIDTEQAVNFYYTVENRKTGIKITFAIIYVVVVSLLLFLSVIISINLASRLTRPIVNLISASEKISSGDLNSKVIEIEADEEFQRLNQNFNSMIDKLKKQQDKLLLSERHSAWESVARKLAHEIKNPLTPIQLSIDRIREKYLNQINKDRNNFSIYLNTINKQIKDIEHLVNEFSDFARMPKPIFKKVNLYEILLNVFNLHKMSESNIDFVISKSKSSYHTKGDEEQLNRVFINLVKNSIESIYVKKNKIIDLQGKIIIDINENNDYIYVNIIDNGVGFEHVDKRKMLTPYFTTKKKGTGLGLSVVVKIINDHNGLILFNTIKDGAKVSIMLPKI